jgi:hypothetical protein
VLNHDDRLRFEEIEGLRRLIAEFKFYNSKPCPLLVSELNQLHVLTKLLASKLNSLHTSVNRIVNKGKE